MTAFALVGGHVVDGSGRTADRADVLVDHGRIAAVGRIGEFNGRRLDVTGLCVTPGFVDAHSHGDDAPLVGGDGSKLVQGVTTEVVGNCGLGLAPRPGGDHTGHTFFPGVEWDGTTVADLFAETDRRGYTVNYAPLVAHGALRTAVAGESTGPLDAAQSAALAAELEAALDAGAIGVSTGLTYSPGRFANAGELELLGTVTARVGGVYATHARSEGRARLAALDEALSVGRRTGVRVQVSHHKAIGRSQWGGIERSLQMVAAARAEGVDVGFDAYPYLATSTTLAVCLPDEFAGLAPDRLLSALATAEAVTELRERLAESDWDNRILDCGGPSAVYLAATATGSHTGRTLAAVAEDWSTDTAGALARLLVENGLDVTMVCFAMSRADVDAALLDPNTCIGSDSASISAACNGLPHPRGAGTFARVLAHLVRERRLLSLEEAVRRMTSLPADVFGLDGIGRIRPGHDADLAVFDPAEVTDRATYREPRRPATGIRHVFIGGHAVVQDGRCTGARVARRLTRGRRPPAVPKTLPDHWGSADSSISISRKDIA